MNRPIFESLEAKFLAWAQMRRKTVVKLGEARELLRLSPQQEKKILSRLARSGVIVRLTNGLYLVPERLPLGGKWSPPKGLVLSELMRSYGGEYQLTGLEVFNRYRFTTQVANVTTAYNDKISGRKKIGNLMYEFIEVPKSRLGGIERISTPMGDVINYPTLGRTLMDAVYDWSRFNTLPKAYEWIAREKKNERVIKDLVDSAITAGNVATRRRVGYWLETLKVNPKFVNKLLRKVKATTAVIPLNPKKPLRGTLNRRWGVIVNG